MFENMNPLDRSTAFIEIGVIILISFVLGYLIGRLTLDGSMKRISFKKKKEEAEEEELNPRDVISEPEGIMATLTRNREGKAMDDLSGE